MAGLATQLLSAHVYDLEDDHFSLLGCSQAAWRTPTLVRLPCWSAWKTVGECRSLGLAPLRTDVIDATAAAAAAVVAGPHPHGTPTRPPFFTNTVQAGRWHERRRPAGRGCAGAAAHLLRQAGGPAVGAAEHSRRRRRRRHQPTAGRAAGKPGRACNCYCVCSKQEGMYVWNPFINVNFHPHTCPACAALYICSLPSSPCGSPPTPRAPLARAAWMPAWPAWRTSWTQTLPPPPAAPAAACSRWRC